MSRQTTELLDVVAKILLRCCLFGFLLLLFWTGVIAFPVLIENRQKHCRLPSLS